ncbi:hypothetical protein [Tessaracoccus sp. MC1756]|uniref:hypothetical protein n=1 Tax=Tessaracoccus sp. MC1756 TaxID=2760311 RepID=UPI0016015112|nr:hypothetical protein [Tessaracoccus sp. MC1756]MBB1510962.1 hypothetical protein [Tessaracoccus sp. MC1756]
MFAFTSAAGSPGVTTTALGLALEWPGEVLLVDADPVGGSPVLAGFYGGTVQHPGTLVELWAAHRQGRLDDALREMPLRIADHASFVSGPAGAAQAGSLTELWQALALRLRSLSGMDVDVLLDLGRLGHQHFPMALARAADELLLVLRSDLVAVAAAAACEIPTDAPTHVALIGAKRPYTAREVSSVVKRDVTVSLPWAPTEAAVFSHGIKETKKSSELRRALRQTAESLRWRADRREEVGYE